MLEPNARLVVHKQHVTLVRSHKAGAVGGREHKHPRSDVLASLAPGEGAVYNVDRRPHAHGCPVENKIPMCGCGNRTCHE